MTDPLWTQFTAADYENRVALYTAAVENGRIDGDLAFDMLNKLFDEAAAHNDRARFNDLVDLLKAQLPAVYTEEAGDLLEWQISNDLVNGRTANLPARTQELAQYAADFPEAVVSSGEKLAYYGQLRPLAAMLHTAWPHIQTTNFDEWLIEEFAVQAMNYVLLDYVETAVTPTSADPQLLAQLDPFAEIDPPALADYLHQITGQTSRTWQPSDFTYTATSEQIPPHIDANLTDLLRQFLYFAKAHSDLPRSRVALAYWSLNEYLIGRLEETARTYRPRRKKKGKFQRKTRGLSPLCPTKLSLAAFIANMLELLTPQHYQAAALMNVLPTWLTFLQQQGLITPSQNARARQELQELLPELRQFWQERTTDPALPHSLTVWETE